MQKPPITLPIARSSVASGVYAALLMGCMLLLMLLVSAVWVGVAVVAGVALWWTSHCRQPTGSLQLVHTGQHWVGSWLLPTGEIGPEQPLRCDYLGPWLVGLRVGRQRIWIWPDSLSAAEQRQLRRCLHHPGR